jgi:hypothetical protein
LALDRYEELLTEAIAKPAQAVQKKLALRNWDFINASLLA